MIDRILSNLLYTIENLCGQSCWSGRRRSLNRVWFAVTVRVILQGNRSMNSIANFSLRFIVVKGAVNVPRKDDKQLKKRYKSKVSQYAINFEK